MTTAGEKLREQRQRAGLSLGQVGEYEGLTPQYLSDLERGRNEPPTWDLIARLARRYHCTIDYLLGISPDPTGYSPGAALPAQGEAMLAVLRDLPEGRQEELVAIGRLMAERVRNEREMHQLLDMVQAAGGEEAMSALLEILELAQTDEDAARARMEAFFRGRTKRRSVRKSNRSEQSG